MMMVSRCGRAVCLCAFSLGQCDDVACGACYSAGMEGGGVAGYPKWRAVHCR